MSRLKELLAGDPDVRMIGSYLDDLDAPRRTREVRDLSRREQARLFEAARGVRPRALGDLTADAEPMEEVVHHGRNTLPMLRSFAKVFVKPGDGARGELWGYNRSGGLIEAAVGPGYFIAHAHHVPGEVLINYLRVPPRRPAGWPPIRGNDERLSRFVYHGTQDVLRGVSEHVSIGRACKAGGRPMPAWFVLCRST